MLIDRLYVNKLLKGDLFLPITNKFFRNKIRQSHRYPINVSNYPVGLHNGNFISEPSY
jgi:hypothetical protein